MPSLHCLFLFHLLKYLAHRPWSPTESSSIITACIIHLYNKAEVANASFCHSGLVFHMYWLKLLPFSRVALSLQGMEVEWETSTIFKSCNEYWTPKRAITVVLGLRTQSNRVIFNILLHTACYLAKCRWLNSCFLIYIMKTIQRGKSHVLSASSLKHARRKAWNQVLPVFPFKI